MTFQTNKKKPKKMLTKRNPLPYVLVLLTDP